jgi:hypothetical protein
MSLNFNRRVLSIPLYIGLKLALSRCFDSFELVGETDARRTHIDFTAFLQHCLSATWSV